MPTGPSKLCLSCHDGTVAVDEYGGTGSTAGIGTTYVDSFNTSMLNYNLDDGASVLMNDHPVSFAYADVATNDVDGNGQGSEIRGLDVAGPQGVTPRELMWGDHDGAESALKMECSSCHDVHAGSVQGDAPNEFLLTVDNNDAAQPSGLCRTCHVK